VVWALARADLAREFDRVIVLGDGRIVDEGTFAALEHKEGGTLATMLAAH
jgi:ABC-type multidrug transport system fused ATPase/permease subunit